MMCLYVKAPAAERRALQWRISIDAGQPALPEASRNRRKAGAMRGAKRQEETPEPRRDRPLTLRKIDFKAARAFMPSERVGDIADATCAACVAVRLTLLKRVRV
jgi:hypothetical protein